MNLTCSCYLSFLVLFGYLALTMKMDAVDSELAQILMLSDFRLVIVRSPNLNINYVSCEIHDTELKMLISWRCTTKGYGELNRLVETSN